MYVPSTGIDENRTYVCMYLPGEGCVEIITLWLTIRVIKCCCLLNADADARWGRAGENLAETFGKRGTFRENTCTAGLSVRVITGIKALSPAVLVG